jgi:branched-chain amino acid transport system ATP-binding protein
MLRLEELCVTYGEINAVRRVSLTIEPGEFVGLIGPNGAGKSSTLHAIAGVVPLASGRIVFDGRDITRSSVEAIARLGIGLVPEGRQVFSRLTVEENLRLAAQTLRRGRTSVLLDGIFERFPVLREQRRRPGGQLSGGEQQQLVIARALLGEPRLLMLDEPSHGLAPRLVDGLFGLLTELHEEGRTILLVEQQAYQTLRAASRSYVMSNGEVRLMSMTGDSVDRQTLIETYLRSAVAGDHDAPIPRRSTS